MKSIFKQFGVLLALVIFVSSCTTGPKGKLIGTWKAKKVETAFDEQQTTPEMLKQVIEMQKETYFKIINDSMLLIISPDKTHEATWSLNPADKTISYSFNGPMGYLNKLGILKDGKIVAKSVTQLGEITIYYEKE